MSDPFTESGRGGCSAALSGDIARLLHQALCARVDVGKRKRFRIDTLASYVWSATAERETIRKRRTRLEPALLELRNIGWEVGMEPSWTLPIWIGRPTIDGSTLFWGAIRGDRVEILATDETSLLDDITVSANDP